MAQLICPGELHEDRFPVFCEDSIAARHISKIVLRNTSKPSSRPIYDHGRRSVYEFDNEGRLSHLLLVFPIRNKGLDTIEHHWIYRAGELVSELESTGAYVKRTRYQDEPDGSTTRSVQIKHHSDEWQSVGRDVVRMEEQDSRTVFSIATGNNPPYEECVTTYIEGGLPETREVWNGPRLQTKESWNYEDSTITYSRFVASEVIPQMLITYNYKGETLDKGRFCRRADCKDWSLFYYPDGLPKAWLFIDPVTQDLDIWEFTYEIDH